MCFCALSLWVFGVFEIDDKEQVKVLLKKKKSGIPLFLKKQ